MIARGYSGDFRSIDADYWLQRFTPRRPRSKWSKTNHAEPAELIECGLVQPAGMREVERVKAHGRWEAAYDGQRTATAPDDLLRALEKNDVARQFFSTLDRVNRHAILYQVQDATKPAGRARRIEKYAAMLSEQKKLYP
ncbi:MAG: YdeI/OmpD-associated family protein [Chloroflexota bacterium]|nr:YdeI/OmpD-associated family protein [Chloroflexota bacterium]